jgi:hypothetical protein
MSNDNVIPFNKGEDALVPSQIPLKSGDGGGTFDDMEPRVRSLEEDMKEIKRDLKALLIDSAEIKGTLKSMPSAATMGELKGRVDSLPTIGKLGSLIGIATGVIVVLNNWSAIKAWLAG